VLVLNTEKSAGTSDVPSSYPNNKSLNNVAAILNYSFYATTG
jgi:hypothetical protein